MTMAAEYGPISEAMYLMMSADGKVTNDEREVLKGALRNLSGDTVRGASTSRRMLDAAAKRGRGPRRAPAVEVVETLHEDPASAEVAFVLAAAIAFADNAIADEENETLNSLAEGLGIDEDARQRAARLRRGRPRRAARLTATCRRWRPGRRPRGSDASADGSLPERIGTYRVLRRLATGGTSDVLLARAEGPRGSEQTVVLKLLLQEFREDLQFEKMFATEAARTRACRTRRLSSSTTSSPTAISSSWCSSTSTACRCTGCARCSSAASSSTTRPRCSWRRACSAPWRLRTRRADPKTGEPSPVIHRDVNPSNVLIPWDGQAKIADFGIAKVTGVDNDKTAAGFIKGTYGYMAPEQVRGENVTESADVYAACLVLWELLVGRKAIVRGGTSDLDVLRAMAEPAFPALSALRPELPLEVLDVVERGLQPDPGEAHDHGRGAGGRPAHLVQPRGRAAAPHRCAERREAARPPRRFRGDGARALRGPPSTPRPILTDPQPSRARRRLAGPAAVAASGAHAIAGRGGSRPGQGHHLDGAPAVGGPQAGPHPAATGAGEGAADLGLDPHGDLPPGKTGGPPSPGPVITGEAIDAATHGRHRADPAPGPTDVACAGSAATCVPGGPAVFGGSDGPDASAPTAASTPDAGSSSSSRHRSNASASATGRERAARPRADHGGQLRGLAVRSHDGRAGLDATPATATPCRRSPGRVGTPGASSASGRVDPSTSATAHASGGGRADHVHRRARRPPAWVDGSRRGAPSSRCSWRSSSSRGSADARPAPTSHPGRRPPPRSRAPPWQWP